MSGSGTMVGRSLKAILSGHKAPSHIHAMFRNSTRMIRSLAGFRRSVRSLSIQTASPTEQEIGNVTMTKAHNHRCPRYAHACGQSLRRQCVELLPRVSCDADRSWTYRFEWTPLIWMGMHLRLVTVVRNEQNRWSESVLCEFEGFS